MNMSNDMALPIQDIRQSSLGLHGPPHNSFNNSNLHLNTLNI